MSVDAPENYDPRAVIPRAGACLVELATVPATGAGKKGQLVAWSVPTSQNALHLSARLYGGRVLLGTWKRGGITAGDFVILRAWQASDLGGFVVVVDWTDVIARVPH